MRIGLISDTHIDAEPLPDQVFRALVGVSLILHAGDIYAPGVLAQLAAIAPVYAARGNGDKHFLKDPSACDGEGYRVRGQHLLEYHGAKIGLMHAFPTPDDEPYVDHSWLMHHHFGLRPAIIVCGDTHVEDVSRVGATTIVNPGSPTLPHHIKRLGTVGILEISDAGFSVDIIQL